MNSAEAAECFFAGLERIKDVAADHFQQLCRALGAESVDALRAQFGQLSDWLDVFHHLAGAGLSARDGDTDDARAEVAALLDALKKGANGRREHLALEAASAGLATNPKRLSPTQLRQRRHLWALVKSSIQDETVSLTEMMGLSDRPVGARSQRSAKDHEDGSVQLADLLNWFNFAYDLSSALEYSLTGQRREAAAALRNAKNLAVDSIGGNSLEVLKCTQGLSNYVSDRWRPTKKMWQFAAASALGAGVGLTSALLLKPAAPTRTVIRVVDVAPPTTSTTTSTTSPVTTVPPPHPITGPVPGAPQDLSAMGGDGKVVLSWIAPGPNKRSPVIGYDIYKGASPGQESQTPVNTSPVNTTTFSVSGLYNGMPYYFTVEAVSTNGNSTASNEVSATPSGPVATVTMVSPSSGTTTGGTRVTISGANFSKATAVTFGLISISSFTIESDGQIVATSPAESAGTVDVTITTPSGTSATSNLDHFVYFTYFATVPTI